jgi:hypothetical protein
MSDGYSRGLPEWMASGTATPSAPLSPKGSEPMPPYIPLVEKCELCTDQAVYLVWTPEGCACRPRHKFQSVCEQHFAKMEDIAGKKIVAELCQRRSPSPAVEAGDTLGALRRALLVIAQNSTDATARNIAKAALAPTEGEVDLNLKVKK